tara:strand:+ start:377 stop:601 length:225 start_codon:yes stop_codon:yes gene_type:complete
MRGGTNTFDLELMNAAIAAAQSSPRKQAVQDAGWDEIAGCSMAHGNLPDADRVGPTPAHTLGGMIDDMSAATLG